eukprot:m.25381 g.25381  ORF g.25381 m.25381 type:complete len:353 (-) comp4425_c0_seq1:92-1150(-)
MENQPFDEAFDVEDPEEIASVLAVSPLPSRAGRRPDESDLHSPQPDFGSPLGGAAMDSPPQGYSEGSEDEYHDDGVEGAADTLKGTLGDEPSEYSDEEESQSISSSDDEGAGPRLEGAYDPAEYENLHVTPEIKELFGFIQRYTPVIEELDTTLKPFIPDYIPAVGDIDAFIKIPRPDRKETGLGLELVDEPCAAQSDSTVLDLQFRTISKAATSRAVAVKCVEDAQTNTRPVENWVQSITELHRQKPPQSVHYTSEMPDIESLMQEWPADFEAALSKLSLPDADLDVSLPQFVDIICSLLDIPVHESRIQSLHLLFSLFVEFKNSQHFRVANEAEESPDDAAEADQDGLAA